jgi:hypothetical protein
VGNWEEREAVRDAETRLRQLTGEIELLRAEMNRKIDEAADLMRRINSLGGTSSRPRTRGAGSAS